MALSLRPSVMQFAWARPDQDLAPYIGRAHDAGCKVTYMAGTVPEAVRAAKAGADVIIAQGTEGGGHVGYMASMPLIPMVVDAVGDIPVLAAGGLADGRGLVAALALGAQGILLGTRFLATDESPLHPNFKQSIVDSDGHDTQLSEIPDLAAGQVWPGAMTRSRRNKFIERYAGREWYLRQHRAEALARLQAARKKWGGRRGTAVDGTGCRPYPRHLAGRRNRQPHRPGGRGDPAQGLPSPESVQLHVRLGDEVRPLGRIVRDKGGKLLWCVLGGELIAGGI